MQINIRGDKVTVTPAIKEYIEEKLSKLDKYFENPEEIKSSVVIKVKNKEQSIEVTVPTSKFTLRAEEIHADLYAAIDLVIDKLERQVRKNKTRIMSKHVKQNYDFNLSTFEEYEKEEKEDNKIVKRKTIEVKPMNEEEAILQMELLGHQFYMYKDSETYEPAVVYKRNDGNYGVITSE